MPFSNQSTTSRTMFFRKLRYTIPDISSKTDENLDEKVEQNDQKIKEKSKHY